MKARILSGLAFLVMLGFIALSATMLMEMREGIRQAEIRAARNLLAAEADDVDRMLSIYDRSLLSTAALLDDSTLAGASPHVEQLELFNQNLAVPIFGPIRVIDPQGRVTHDSSTLLPTPPTPAEIDDLHRHLHDAGTALLVSRTSQAGGDRGGDIALSHRINDSQGRFAGMVTGTMRLFYISDLFHQLHLGRQDVVNLIGSDGSILVRTPDLPGPGRTIAGSANLGRFQEQSSGTFSARSAIDGTRRLYSFVHVGSWPLLIDVGVSERDLYAPWRRRAWADGLSLLVMVATGLFLTFTLRRELRRRIAAERGYRLLADHASDVILRLDRDLRLVYMSPSCRQYGYDPVTLLGIRMPAGLHADDAAKVRHALLQAQADRRDLEISYRQRRRNGGHVWVEARFDHVAGDGGFIAIIRDISRRKAAEIDLERANADLERLATTDALTGLSNRRAFDDGLRLEWSRALRANSSLSVMLIDVDHFKRFNDRYGHPAGDAVLRAVATAIRGCIRRPGDLAARYGGEEFVLILPGTEQFGAIDVADAIRTAITTLSLTHEGSASGRITVSIGIASTLPGMDGTDAATLLASADAALYSAKRNGRNQVLAAPASRSATRPRP